MNRTIIHVSARREVDSKSVSFGHRGGEHTRALVRGGAIRITVLVDLNFELVCVVDAGQ
jgi:hypothetical protein